MRKTTLLILAVSLFVSCASVAHYDKVDESVFRGDFAAGYAHIEEVKKSAYPPKDRILYYLDSGLLAHYSGDHETAIKQLTEAERAIEAAFTKSVSLEVSTYLVNDNVQEYPGEDYEDIYLNVFKALNYYHTGSIEGALVEIRRIDNKLKYLSTKYGLAVSNAQKAVLEKSSDIPYDKSMVNSVFSNSALARYLSMLFYRSEGKRDDARIDRDQIRIAFANQPSVYAFPVPKSIDDELDIPRGKARLNVISFHGLSPIKVETASRVMLPPSNWVKFAFPELRQRPSRVSRVSVTVDGGARFDLEQIEDLSAVATDTFRQRAALIYFKTVLRSLAKTTSSAVLGSESEKVSSAEAAVVLGLLSIGSQIYAEASEQADLRIARYFPAKSWVGGITLDPGTYSYTVQYFDSSSALIHERRFENQKVQANALNLSEAICLQ